MGFGWIRWRGMRDKFELRAVVRGRRAVKAEI